MGLPICKWLVENVHLKGELIGPGIPLNPENMFDFCGELTHPTGSLLVGLSRYF